MTRSYFVYILTNKYNGVMYVGMTNNLERRMQGAVNVLKQEFGGLRTGRANAALLDPVMVNAYGSSMPLNQLATVSVPEPRMISVQVWDKTQVSAVEKAIREADLGINPIVRER